MGESQAIHRRDNPSMSLPVLGALGAHDPPARIVKRQSSVSLVCPCQATFITKDRDAWLFVVQSAGAMTARPLSVAHASICPRRQMRVPEMTATGSGKSGNRRRH